MKIRVIVNIGKFFKQIQVLGPFERPEFFF